MYQEQILKTYLLVSISAILRIIKESEYRTYTILERQLSYGLFCMKL